jgi:hypothetical protein
MSIQQDYFDTAFLEQPVPYQMDACLPTVLFKFSRGKLSACVSK